MNSLISLVKRNLKIFYRKKSNVFFSLFSAVILVSLHFVVFRKMQIDYWTNIASHLPVAATQDHLAWIVDSLMFAALIPLFALSVTLVNLGLIVADKEKNVISDFLVSPIHRTNLLASYLISSGVITLTVSLGFIALFEVYFLAMFGISFSLIQFLLILLATIGATVFSNVFILLLISFVKTQQALGGLGASIGTGSGFMSGAYIPMISLGSIVGNIFSCLPLLQLTVLSRQAFFYDLAKVTPFTPEMFTGKIAWGFGLEVWIFDKLIPTEIVILILCLVTLALLIALILRFRVMKKAE